MSIYIYIYIYDCVCVFVHVCMYVCMYVCVKNFAALFIKEKQSFLLCILSQVF